MYILQTINISISISMNGAVMALAVYITWTLCFVLVLEPLRTLYLILIITLLKCVLQPPHTHTPTSTHFEDSRGMDNQRNSAIRIRKWLKKCAISSRQSILVCYRNSIVCSERIEKKIKIKLMSFQGGNPINLVIVCFVPFHSKLSTSVTMPSIDGATGSSIKWWHNHVS